MKTAEEILQEIADEMNEGYGRPTYLANYSNMKYDAEDVLKAMRKFAQQSAPTRERIIEVLKEFEVLLPEREYVYGISPESFETIATQLSELAVEGEEKNEAKEMFKDVKAVDLIASWNKPTDAPEEEIVIFDSHQNRVYLLSECDKEMVEQFSTRYTKCKMKSK